MENFIVAVSCVTPVFIFLLVGYGAKRRNIIPETVYPYLNKFSFTVLLSAKMFHNMYLADFGHFSSPKLLAYLVVSTVLLFSAAGVLLSRWVRDPRIRGVYWQNAYRTNVTIIGIALMEVLSDAAGVALMTVAVSILVPLYNILAVIALERCSGETFTLKGTLVHVLKNPLVFGTLLGLLTRSCGIVLPDPVESAISSLGRSGMTLALVTLGASFDFSGLRHNLRHLLLGNGIRLVLSPLVVVLSAIALGFRGDALSVILLCAATPLATTAFTMAQLYGSDDQLTGQLVVTSSLLSCLTLFLWIFLLKQLTLI